MKSEAVAMALIEHLEEDDAMELEELISEGADLERICSHINTHVDHKIKAQILNRLAPKYPILEDFIDNSPRFLEVDQYPPTVRREMEFTEYLDQLDPDQQEYVKQFYYEYYNKGHFGIPEDDRILSSDEMIKEANRVSNSLYRDAFSYTRNREMLNYLEDENQEPYYEQPTDWQTVFVARGYEPALECILNDAMAELDNSKLDMKATLVRFYIKMDRLRKLNNRDLRTRKESKRG